MKSIQKELARALERDVFFGGSTFTGDMSRKILKKKLKKSEKKVKKK